MKIFFISHSSVIPNYQEKLRLLAKRKNIDLTLLLPQSWPEAGKKVKTSSQPKETEGFRVISAPIFFEGRIKRHFYPYFDRYVEQVKPDILHIEEEPYSLVAWQAAKAARKLGIPLVFFTWENLLENFTFPHQAIRRAVLKTAAYAIAGDLEAGQLLEKAHYPSSRISVIPQYGVNPGLFRKKNVSGLKKELKLGSFTVGYVGRLVPEKGLHSLLEAFALLKNSKTSMLIVGGGSLRDDLERKSAELSVASQVRWISAMDQTQVPEYLNCMDVLVLPSVTTPHWKEQFGRVIIEAQACEIPVIGSDSGAIPEVIGKAGLIFPEGNVDQLRQLIQKLLSNPRLREDLGKKGRKRIQSLYTNQIVADKIYRIYRKILGNHERI